MKTAISTDKAPGAIGPYSQAVEAGGMVFVSGQLGMDPATGAMVEGGVQAETRQTLENLKAILAAAGCTLAQVVQVQVFLADMADFAPMNEVYARYFTTPYPARAAFQVAKLPKDGRVEIMAVAVR